MIWIKHRQLSLSNFCVAERFAGCRLSRGRRAECPAAGLASGAFRPNKRPQAHGNACEEAATRCLG
jgi:hypothetical protein